MRRPPASPKATAAGVTAAVVTLIMYVLHGIPYIQAMPDTAEAAVLCVVTGIVTWAAGWLRREYADHQDSGSG